MPWRDRRNCGIFPRIPCLALNVVLSGRIIFPGLGKILPRLETAGKLRICELPAATPYSLTMGAGPPRRLGGTATFRFTET